MKVVFRPNGFDEEFVKGAITELLKALDYLHSCANVIHTGMVLSFLAFQGKLFTNILPMVQDVHHGNMLIGTYDNDVFRRLEETELESPVARKLLSHTRTIYLSRAMRPKRGPMLLCDFGEARIGPGPHTGHIMPLQYRAPEILLHVDWSYPVDIWSAGLTVGVGSGFIIYFAHVLIICYGNRPGTCLNQKTCLQHRTRIVIFAMLHISLN